MLAAERHRIILSELEQSGSVRVTELAQRLRVTEETIRRDLDRLNEDGRLVRTHGGAVTNLRESRELPFSMRHSLNRDEKRAIAREAVSLIREGDVIALDASSTALELANVLPDMRLTVVTNSMAVMSLLLDREQVRVVSTGGVVDPPSLSYVGPLAEAALDRFNINTLFLSSKGVDLDRGLSVAEEPHAVLKRRMMDAAETSVLLVDHTKLEVRSVVFFAGLDDLDMVITDRGADPRVLEELTARGLAVRTAQ